MYLNKSQQLREQYLDVAVSGETEQDRLSGLHDLLAHINTHKRRKVELVLSIVEVQMRLYPDHTREIRDSVLEQCNKWRKENDDYGVLNSDTIY